MIQIEAAKAAADALLSAALLGDPWANDLQRLADASEARGISLTRVRGGSAVAAIASTDWVDAEAALVTGHAPHSPRMFFPEHAYSSGFLGETDVWDGEKLRHDPFYQEFLRPRGAFFHAKLRLTAEPGERLTLSLKRSAKFGPYDPADIAALNRLVPRLRTAVRIAQRMLNAEATGLVRALHQRGDPVFELDACGRVLRTYGGDEYHGVITRERRLAVTDRRAQDALDRAIARAIKAPQQPTLVAISNQHDRRTFVHLIPMVGRARDVFLSTAAMAVIVKSSGARVGALSGGIKQVFGLTAREEQIASLLVEGFDPRAISEQLGLGIGTVRNHIKSIFAKTNTHRQGEFVALLNRLRR